MLGKRFKKLEKLLHNFIKLRQNCNILDNLLKANRVTKNEKDIIIKARMTRYLIDKKIGIK